MQSEPGSEDMGDTETHNVLGRIAAKARAQRKARAMTLQKALRVTMAKVADSLMGLPVAVLSSTLQDVAGDEIESSLDDSTLLLLLDGPGGCAGAVRIEPVVVGALIQQQTIGSVSGSSDPERLMTRTDAAICAPVIDTLFARVAPILDDADERALIEGFCFGAKAQDARTLAMALDANTYTVIKLTLDIARGARQGEMVLILPTLEARADQQDAPDGVTGPDGETGKSDMARLVMGLNADLRMVLCQLNLSLKNLNALKVGHTLALTPGAFPNVQITTSTGRVLGRGVVGHVDGVRAVRPLRPPSHASQPLRRVSDQPLVDMPEVEVLTSTGRRATLPREVDVSEEEVEAAMQALPPVSERRHAPAAADGMDEDDLDIPFPVIDESSESPGPDDIPDLDELPDLDDLPDLADMPDLAMNAAG